MILTMTWMLGIGIGIHACPVGEEGSIKFVRTFLEARFSKDKDFSEFVAPKITLLPGHEYLKERYGVVGAGQRSTSKEVNRDDFVKVTNGLRAELTEKKAARLRELLSKCDYTLRSLKKGDNTVDPPDPVGTPDKKIHLLAEEGDALVFVRPKPKGDFLFFVVRKIEGKRKIVAEYVD